MLRGAGTAPPPRYSTSLHSARAKSKRCMSFMNTRAFPPKTYIAPSYTTAVCSARGGGVPVAAIASQRYFLKSNAHKSFSSKSFDSPPKTYILSPCTTAVCECLGSGRAPLTTSVFHLLSSF